MARIVFDYLSRICFEFTTGNFIQFSEYRIKEKSLVVGQVVLGLLILWSLLYNILIKKQHLFEAFFGIIDTLTEDLFMRMLGYGLFSAIVIVFVVFLSQRYAQMLASNSFFRQMEIILTSEMEDYKKGHILTENGTKNSSKTNSNKTDTKTEELEAEDQSSVLQNCKCRTIDHTQL